MAESGQEIEGPGGMKLLLVDVPVDRGTETLVMEAAYSGTGGAPGCGGEAADFADFLTEFELSS